MNFSQDLTQQQFEIEHDQKTQQLHKKSIKQHEQMTLAHKKQAGENEHWYISLTYKPHLVLMKSPEIMQVKF